MAVFITGDCHGDFTRFSHKNFPRGRNLDKNDYIIILGDVGILWNKELTKDEEYWIKWLDSKPWTTLFILGNHENYDRWEKIPIEEWHGGKIQKLASSIIHLMRGQVFDICGKTFFTMGGAPSQDIRDGVLEIGDPRINKWRYDRTKLFRINHISWWEQEIPSEEEWTEAYKNLAKVNNKVDFVLTHEAPLSIVPFVGIFPPGEMSKRLQKLGETIDYKVWYCGHYHLNKHINPNHSCYFEAIDQIV